MSSTTIGTVVHPHSANLADFMRFVLPPVRVGMPFHAVVLGDDICVGPGEVHPPHSAVQVDDCVLQFGQGQAAVDEHQTRFAFHRRFGACVGKRQEFADLDYAAPSLVLINHRDQLRLRAAPGVQRGIEYRKRAWSTQGPCYLDRGPRGGRDEPTAHRFSGAPSRW